jgi:hypothetical protein
MSIENMMREIVFLFDAEAFYEGQHHLADRKPIAEQGRG